MFWIVVIFKIYQKEFLIIISIGDLTFSGIRYYDICFRYKTDIW